MGTLLDFFGGGALRLKALIIGALAAAAACAALFGVAMLYKAEAARALGQRDVAIAQAQALVGAVNRCTASVERAAKAGDEAVATSRKLLAAAERAAAGAVAQVKGIEQILAKGTPQGAGCEDAWKAIEANRKAGAAP